MGDVNDPVALEHEAAFRGNRLAICGEGGGNSCGGIVIDPRQHRRLFKKPPRPVDVAMAGLEQQRFAGGLLGLGNGLGEHRPRFRIELIDRVIPSRIGMQIPAFHHPEILQTTRVETIAIDGPHHRRPPLVLIEPVLARRDVDAGDQPLQIPLPRPDHALVEIVQVKHHVPLRRAEQAEIVEMRVAIDDRCQTGDGCVREVPGHHRARPAQEPERRRRHSAHADRHEFRLPSLVGLEQHLHRIRPVGGRLPTAVGGMGNVLAQPLSLLLAQRQRLETALFGIVGTQVLPGLKLEWRHRHRRGAMVRRGRDGRLFAAAHPRRRVVCFLLVASHVALPPTDG